MMLKFEAELGIGRESLKVVGCGKRNLEVSGQCWTVVSRRAYWRVDALRAEALLMTNFDNSPVPSNLWQNWLALWNGALSLADDLIADDFTLHAAMMDGSDSTAIRGPKGLAEWIAQTRAAFPDLAFTTQVGPIVQDDHVAGRWQATGTYQGGFPGAKAEPGTVVTFTGADLLRLADGKIVEYWLNSDTLQLLAALGVV
jgi:predicted ester cyclase